MTTFISSEAIKSKRRTKDGGSKKVSVTDRQNEIIHVFKKTYCF